MIKTDDPSKVTFTDWPNAYYMDLNSAIGYPINKQDIRLESNQKDLLIKGWAFGNLMKGTQVTKVEVSFDQGKTWKEAEIWAQENKEPG